MVQRVDEIEWVAIKVGRITGVIVGGRLLGPVELGIDVSDETKRRLLQNTLRNFQPDMSVQPTRR